MGALLGTIGFHHNREWFSGRELFQVALRCPQFDHVPLERLKAIFETFAPGDLNPTRRWRPYYDRGRPYRDIKLAPLSSHTGICCRFCGQVFFPPGPRNVDSDEKLKSWYRAQWAHQKGWDEKYDRPTESLKCPLGDALPKRAARFWMWEFYGFEKWSNRSGMDTPRWLSLYFPKPWTPRSLWPWCSDCEVDLFVPFNVVGHAPVSNHTTDAQDDARYIGRLSRLLSRRSYRQRLERFAGNAIRAVEFAANRDAYEHAEWFHWDPEVHAKWIEQDRLRDIAETAARKAFTEALAASIMGGRAA